MPQGFLITELLKCVDREINFRQKVYPRYVAQLKLSADNASMEMIRIRGVREYLIRGEAMRLILAMPAEVRGEPAEAMDARIKAMVRELIVMYPAPPEPPRG